MNAAYGTYKRTGGFINGTIAWFKCIAIGVGVIGGFMVLMAGAAVLFGSSSASGLDRVSEVSQHFLDPKTLAMIFGIPVGLMVYYLPWFIDVRKSYSGDGLVMGFICNTLFGWFPPFYMIMMALAITKN